MMDPRKKEPVRRGSKEKNDQEDMGCVTITASHSPCLAPGSSKWKEPPSEENTPVPEGKRDSTTVKMTKAFL